MSDTREDSAFQRLRKAVVDYLAVGEMIRAEYDHLGLSEQRSLLDRAVAAREAMSAAIGEHP